MRAAFLVTNECDLCHMAAIAKVRLRKLRGRARVPELDG